MTPEGAGQGGPDGPDPGAAALADRRGSVFMLAAAARAGFDARRALPRPRFLGARSSGAGPIVWPAAAPYRRGEGRRARRRQRAPTGAMLAAARAAAWRGGNRRVSPTWHKGTTKGQRRGSPPMLARCSCQGKGRGGAGPPLLSHPQLCRLASAGMGACAS